MITFLWVLSGFALLAVIYLLVIIFTEHRPHCYRCGHALKYRGEDESGMEVWECPKCGEKMLL